jgi:hypothetical protein
MNSNERNHLIEILKLMYEDNISQIATHTTAINSIRNTNIQIRNLLVEILFDSNRFRSTNPTYTDLSTSTAGRLTGNFINRNLIQNNNNNNNLSRMIQSFLNPVDVYPTPSQIETSTRNVQYADIVNPIYRTCPISLELFNDSDTVTVIRYCGHIFNTRSLNTWFQTSCRCPVCRYDIRDYRASQERETTDASNNSVQIDPSNNVLNPLINTFTTYFDIILDPDQTNDTNTIASLLDTFQRRR